jgi:hypothetical protein
MFKIKEFFLPKGWSDKEKKQTDDYKFKIYYDSKVIADFSYNNETKVYRFEYTEEAKDLGERAIVPDFPNLEKVYESKYLAPFFISRIPPPNRPLIKEEREEKGIAEDPLSLLEHFGRRTWNNPFIVEKVKD